MAVKTLEETLSQLSADERKLFETTVTKYPELKEGWLRQDDYSRKLNEFKSKETEFETAKARAAELDAWADRNVPIYNTLVEKGIVDENGEELWTQQKTELEKQLEEARKAAVAGGDMDPAELDKRIKEITKAYGVMSPEEQKALINSEAKKLAEEVVDTKYKEFETKFNEKTIPWVGGFAGRVATTATAFERETGQPWTADSEAALYKLMADEKNFDAFAVRDKFLAPYIEKKNAKKAEEERVEAEVQKRIKSMRGMPGGGDEEYIPPDEQKKGALRQMLERSAEGGGDLESLLKSKTMEAATELQREGKG